MGFGLSEEQAQKIYNQYKEDLKAEQPDAYDFYMKEETINTSYFYKLIRHPMYLGIILLYLTSTTIYSDVFLVNLFSIIFYVELGSYFEEKTLVRKFGLTYKIYKLKTNKYIPFLR